MKSVALPTAVATIEEVSELPWHVTEPKETLETLFSPPSFFFLFFFPPLESAMTPSKLSSPCLRLREYPFHFKFGRPNAIFLFWYKRILLYCK